MLAQLDPLPVHIDPLRTPDTERLEEKYRTLSTPEHCITCKGRKSFRWKNPEEDGTYCDWECNCRDQYVLHRALLNAGIGLAYQWLSWSDASVRTEVQEFFQDYLLKIDDYVSRGLGLILHGTPGTGKTMYAALLLKFLLKCGHSCYFTTFQDLLEIFTAGWGSEEKKQWYQQRVRQVGVLVVDDIGKENTGRSTMVEALVHDLFNARVANALPTIITTNMDLDHLGTRYTEQIVSLLSESCEDYRFSGEDFRPEFHKRRKAEADLGLTRPIVLI